MSNYKKYLEMTKKNKDKKEAKPSLDSFKKYADGGKAKEEDAKWYPPIPEENSKDPIYNEQGSKDNGKGDDQILSPNELRKYPIQKVNPNQDSNLIYSLNEGGQIPYNQQKDFQAKDYFGKGANGAGEGVANSMGVMMNKGGPVKEIPFKELIAEHQKLVKDLKGPHDQHEIQKKELQQYLQEYAKLKGYAFGGVTSGANTVGSLSPILKNTYAPTEKKYPLNIPKAARIKVPKRLKPIDIIKGYADGTPDVENQKMDLGDMDIAPSTPYPGEEEEAQTVVSQSTPGQIADELNKQQDVVQQIDAALGNDKNQPSDEEQSQQDVKNLDGMTLSKDEARQPASDKSDEEQPSSEEPMVLDVGKGSSPMEELKLAQDRQDKINFYNTLGAISDKTAAAMGNYKSNNQDIYKRNMDNAASAVKQVEQRIAVEKYDPNSPTSKAFKQYLEKFGVKPQGDFTADMGEKLMPFAFKQFEAKEAQKTRAANSKERNEERLEQAEMQAHSREDIARENRKAHLEQLQLLQQQRQDALKEKADRKLEDDRNKAYQKARKDLETFRGNQGAQQSSRDILSADKALQLVEGKDPNKLTIQDLNLLADEMGKIATGGVPTEKGTQALMPNNLSQKYAEMKNFLLSKPTDTQAGDYIRRNLEYLKNMRGVAQGTLDNYRMNLAKGYKNLLNPDDYEEMLQDYNLSKSSPQPQSISNPNKSVIRKGYNSKTNQTQFIYSDGTSEIKDGKL